MYCKLLRSSLDEGVRPAEKKIAFARVRKIRKRAYQLLWNSNKRRDLVFIISNHSKILSLELIEISDDRDSSDLIQPSLQRTSRPSLPTFTYFLINQLNHQP